jgi:hypothetical protein
VICVAPQGLTQNVQGKAVWGLLHVQVHQLAMQLTVVKRTGAFKDRQTYELYRFTLILESSFMSELTHIGLCHPGPPTCTQLARDGEYLAKNFLNALLPRRQSTGDDMATPPSRSSVRGRSIRWVRETREGAWAMTCCNTLLGHWNWLLGLGCRHLHHDGWQPHGSNEHGSSRKQA